MKLLGIFALIACAALSAVCQGTSIDAKAFDAIIKRSYQVYEIWNGVGFRKSTTVEARAPGHNYELQQVFEFDAAAGVTRMLYREIVEGKETRPPREVITVNDSSYIRDVGKGSWWVSTREGMGKVYRNAAYVPDPDEAQAVSDYFVRERYDIAGKESEISFLGAEKVDDLEARLYSKTEIIKGTRTKDGSPMRINTVMRYWFGEDGAVVKADTESRGNVGSEEYYRRITVLWKRDPSIKIIVPFRAPGNSRRP